jgi:hypothetical protein
MAQDTIQESSFAATVRPQQAKKFTGLNTEINIPKKGSTVIAKANAPGLN